ncbi:MAG: hypothetical protein LBE33_09855 [Zoogloeaceae bacterium]|jgi:hypothetical protein|nr:hypothetical protein [Zoogloeaceae bacterium]
MPTTAPTTLSSRLIATIQTIADYANSYNAYGNLTYYTVEGLTGTKYTYNPTSWQGPLSDQVGISTYNKIPASGHNE